MPPRGAVNPVARPFDKLTGVFSLRGGGGLTSRLEETVVDGVKAALWQVQGKPGAKGWAVYGFGFIDPIDPPPSGLRFEVVLPEETALTLNVCKGFSVKRVSMPQKIRAVAESRSAGRPAVHRFRLDRIRSPGTGAGTHQLGRIRRR